jgi:hypothetical protein
VWVVILFQHYFVVCLNAVAILALEHYVVAVDDMETRLHGLVVGDALGVFAFHYVGELVGQRHGVLVNHFKIANYVDNGVWGDEGNAVESAFGEEHVGNLDEPFFPEELAVEIEAYGHTVLKVLDAKQVDNLEQRLAGYVVDYGAVFESGNG